MMPAGRPLSDRHAADSARGEHRELADLPVAVDVDQRRPDRLHAGLRPLGRHLALRALGGRLGAAVDRLQHVLAEDDHRRGLLGVVHLLHADVEHLVFAVSEAVTNAAAFKTEILNFSYDYAAQVNLDWQALVAAKKAGVPLY